MHAWLGHGLVFFVGLGVGALVMAQNAAPDVAPQATQDVAAVSSAPVPSASTIRDAPPGPFPDSQLHNSAVTQILNQLQAEQAARQRLADDVERLKDELNALRREVLASVASAIDGATPVVTETDPDVNATPLSEPTEAMVALGVSPQVAADIKRRVDQADLARLQLRDQAAREGWLGTDRYMEELSKVDGDAQKLRDELGDETYDKFLYSTGQINRVQVAGVLDGSAAATAGIRASDTIFAYAGKRIFSWDELRAATADGAAGEYVSVTVLRDDTPVEFLVPRGPLGVKLEATRQRP